MKNNKIAVRLNINKKLHILESNSLQVFLKSKKCNKSNILSIVKFN